MKGAVLRDLDSFEVELEEGRRQIAVRRQAVLERTGVPVSPTRLDWLRRQVLKQLHPSR